MNKKGNGMFLDDSSLDLSRKQHPLFFALIANKPAQIYPYISALILNSVELIRPKAQMVYKMQTLNILGLS